MRERTTTISREILAKLNTEIVSKQKPHELQTPAERRHMLALRTRRAVLLNDVRTKVF